MNHIRTSFVACLAIVVTLFATPFSNTYASDLVTRIDSVHMEIAASDPDTNRVFLYSELVVLFINTDLDSALYYAQAQRDLGKRIGHRSHEANGWNNVGTVKIYQGRYADAVPDLETAIDIYEEEGNHKGLARTLNALGVAHRRLGNFDEAMAHYNKALGALKVIGDKALIATATHNAGAVYFEHGDYAQARLYFESAAEINREINNKQLLSQNLQAIGAVHLKQGRTDAALDYHFKSLELEQEMEDEFDAASIMDDIGQIYEEMGELEEGLRYYLQALVLMEKIGNLAGKEKTLSSIGQNLYHQERYDRALKYYRDALQIAREGEMKPRIGANLTAIGNIFYTATEYDTALSYYTQALVLQDELEEKDATATIFQNTGEIYQAWGRLPLAMEYYQQARQLYETIGDPNGVASCALSMARLELQRGKPDRAVALGKSALEQVRETGARLRERDILKLLADASAADGSFGEAFAYQRAYQVLDDSILDADRSAVLTEMEARFQDSKRQQEIAMLNADKELQDLRYTELKSRQQSQVAVLLTILVLVVLLSAIAIMRQRHKRSAMLARERQIRLQAVISAQELERKRIAGDLHDGLGQLLSLAHMSVASLQGAVYDDKTMMLSNAVRVIEEAWDTARSISHAMMPDALIKLGMVPALRDLVHKINSAGGGVEVEFVTDMGDNGELRMEETKEIALYRIVQELMSNILKHAQASHVKMELREMQGEVLVSVADDGKGFEKEKIELAGGIGWKNIYSRVAMLRGQVRVDSSPGQGTQVNIRFAS